MLCDRPAGRSAIGMPALSAPLPGSLSGIHRATYARLPKPACRPSAETLCAIGTARRTVPPCIRRPVEQSSLSIKLESPTTRCPRTRSSTFALELRRSWRGRKRHLSVIARCQKPRGQCQIGVQRLFATFGGRRSVQAARRTCAGRGRRTRRTSHTAEALLRLTLARLNPEPITGPRCLWAEIATGPRPIEDVIGVSCARARASAPTRYWGLATTL
jgi:hypothetical protein